MCMNDLPTYMSAHHVSTWCSQMPEMSEPLGLKVLMGVSHHVGALN